MYTDGGVSGFLAFLEACTVIDLPADGRRIAFTGSLYELVSMH